MFIHLKRYVDINHWNRSLLSVSRLEEKDITTITYLILSGEDFLLHPVSAQAMSDHKCLRLRTRFCKAVQDLKAGIK